MKNHCVNKKTSKNVSPTSTESSQSRPEPPRRITRSIASAGTTSSSGKGGGTMLVTGLNTGASFGVAGASCRIQIIRSEISMYTAAAVVAGQRRRAARAPATSSKGNTHAAIL